MCIVGIEKIQVSVMATINRVYIVLAFIFSGIAVIFNIVSLATEQWIRGEATWVNATTDINYVYYGLFQGNYQRNAPFSTTYKLTATCSFQHNICAMLCGADSSATATLLDNLYNNNISTSYSMDNCPTVLKFTYNYKSFENLPSSLRTDTVNYVTSKHFINAGVWLSTLLFLILAIVAGLVSTTLALYNTVDNPTEFFLSVKSLFIYNATGFGCTLLSMILWGTMYNLLIFHNVAIYDTIVGSITSDKTVFLGYSYWIGFISLTFYAASTAILYYREYLNERDPRNQKIGLDADSADANLYLY